MDQNTQKKKRKTLNYKFKKRNVLVICIKDYLQIKVNFHVPGNITILSLAAKI